ncbi:MAG: N-acetyltransferase [Cyanobacteriota bacterium]|nr:N-acetyltransferase [Cyanobacteriota bacterium]
MIPFRPAVAAPRLPEGYTLHQEPEGVRPRDCGNDDLDGQLNRLLLDSGDQPRSPDRWRATLERSAWHLRVCDPKGRIVGFVRATSDQALNANLWDLLSDPADPCRQEVITALVRAALGRLRRELGGCSISLSAPPEALEALVQVGFVVDPGGIRAMGLALPRS